MFGGYSPLQAPDSDLDDLEDLKVSFSLHKKPRVQQSTRNPWKLSTFVILILFVCHLTYLFRPQNSFQTGFRTDFAAARSSIETEERVFAGALYYNETAKTFMREDDGFRYFGPPSPEVDAAWAELFAGEWVAMTDEEAAQFPGLTRGGSHFLMEPDMSHSLHCLDAIRRMFHKDYYSKQHDHKALVEEVASATIPNWHNLHLEHCLEQLQQSVMCAGDMSPVPRFSWEGQLIQFGVGQTHTCRKNSRVRDWWIKRNKEMGLDNYKERDSGENRS